MIAVPLTIVASLLTNNWWAVVPLTVCAWWWAPREPGWGWLVAVLRGVVGWEWALVGANALIAFPARRTTIGVVWIASALAIAALATFSRRSAEGGTVPRRKSRIAPRGKAAVCRR
jgi:hypothetical protein